MFSLAKNRLSTLRILSLPALALIALALVSCSGLPAQAAPAQPAPADLLNVSSTPQLGQVLVTGTVTGIANGQITVGDLAFRVDEQTQLPADLQAGNQAQVLAIRLPDNTHYALEVSKVSPANAPVASGTAGPKGAGEFEMFGLVQAIGTDGWQISDMGFQVPVGANVKGNIQVGDVVKIEGAVSQGIMTAHEIDLVLGSVVTPAANPQGGQTTNGENASGVQNRSTLSGDHELYGVVEAVGATWTISGTAFVVDANTRIDGNVVVGSRVQGHYVQQADGSFLATKIELDDDSENYGATPSSGDHHDSEDAGHPSYEDDQGENHDQQDSSGGDHEESHDSGGSHNSGESHD